MGLTINPNNPQIGGLPAVLGITEAGMKKIMKKIDQCKENIDPTTSSSQILLSVLGNKSWKPLEKLYFAYLYGIIVDQNLPFLSEADAANRIMNGIAGWDLNPALSILQSLVITLIANNPVMAQSDKEGLIMAYSDYLAHVACDPEHNFGRSLTKPIP